MWDGLTTSNDTRILVLGATNRPNDIDSAILRRMPKRFAIKLPDAHQRRNILTLMLKDIRLEPGFDIEALVKKTDGLSGSDLKEACRNAAMVRPSPSFSHSLSSRRSSFPLSRSRCASTCARTSPTARSTSRRSKQGCVQPLLPQLSSPSSRLTSLLSLLQKFDIRPLAVRDFLRSDDVEVGVASEGLD